MCRLLKGILDIWLDPPTWFVEDRSSKEEASADTRCVVASLIDIVTGDLIQHLNLVFAGNFLYVEMKVRGFTVTEITNEIEAIKLNQH